MRTQLSKIDDYPKFLNEHWELHLAKRKKNAPTVISTFAGCGGSSLGYSFAGFKELLAVEYEKNAVETFKLNFSGIPVFDKDIKDLTVKECLKLANIKKGELDILDGSPPCQGFSTAGKRVMQDSRNFLFREYIRLLKGLMPKVFVMENVSGMVKGKMKLIFVEILKELKKCGYKVKAVLMNAMYFGVPQSRQRLIFIGVREDLGIESSFPKALTKPISVKDAINIDNLYFKESKGYRSNERINIKCPAPITGAGHFGGTSYSQLKIKATRSQRINPWINSNKSAATICKTAQGYEVLQDKNNIRSLTIDEAKFLHSYPDAFKFIGSYSNQWGRIGNSVPPLFMKAIAEHIKQNILNKINA